MHSIFVVSFLCIRFCRVGIGIVRIFCREDGVPVITFCCLIIGSQFEEDIFQ